MIQKQKQSSRSKMPLLVIIAALVLAAGLLWLLIAHWHHKPTSYTANQPHSTGGQYTKGEGSTSSTGSTSTGDPNSTTSSSDKRQTDGGGNSSATIITPTGNFVSAHHISLAADPLMQSSCQTTPNITCQITFTNGNTILRLDAQTTDSGGSVYWNWSPEDIGLTTGSWKVQANAHYQDKNATANDALNLEVAP